MKIIIRLFALNIILLGIYIVIHNDLYFNKSLFYIGDDPLRVYNLFYYAVDNFSKMHIPFFAAEKNCGEPSAIYHTWLGIYSIQNLILGFTVKLFSLNQIPFKYLFLLFYRFFNNLFLTAGFYLILRRFTRDRQILIYCFIFLTLFGFYSADLDYTPSTIFFGFFINSVFDFFYNGQSKKNFIILILLTALMFHYSLIDSASMYFCGISIIIGSLISMYFGMINFNNIICFFKNNKIFVILVLLSSGIILFPNLYIYFSYIKKFDMPRSFMDSKELSFDNINYEYFKFMLPSNLNGLYIGWFAIIIIMVGLFLKQYSKYTPVFYSIIIVPSTIFILKNSSSSVYNFFSWLIPNIQLQRWSGYLIHYSTIIFVVPFCYYLDFFINNRHQYSFKNVRKIMNIIIFILIFIIIGLFFLNSEGKLSSLKYILIYYLFITGLSYLFFVKCMCNKIITAKIIVLFILIFEILFISIFKDDYPFESLKKLPQTTCAAIESNHHFDNTIYTIDEPKNHTENYPEIYSYTDVFVHKKNYFPVKKNDSQSPYHNFKLKITESILIEKDYSYYQKYFNKKFIVFPFKTIENNNKLIFEGFINQDVSIPENHQAVIEILKINADKFMIKSVAEQQNIVFFNQPFDSKWTLKINGVKAEIYKIFRYFMGFNLPAGNNIVEIEYQDNILKLFIVINYIATFLLGCYIFAKYFIWKNI